MEKVKIPPMSDDIVACLAGVIARRNLVATPEQCEEFYSTETGKRMLAMIDAERKEPPGSRAAWKGKRDEPDKKRVPAGGGTPGGHKAIGHR